MQLGSLLQNEKKKRQVLEKLVLRKAGTGGKEKKNLAREQVGQCSCSLDWCLCHVAIMPRTHFECMLCAFILVYSCVLLQVCVSTAGQRGGNTAGRRCALQSASPPGTGL